MKRITKRISEVEDHWKIIILVLLVGIGGLFYWYEYRPSQIRSECHKEAMEAAQNSYEDQYPWREENIKKGYYMPVEYENYFEQCLRKRGINK